MSACYFRNRNDPSNDGYFGYWLNWFDSPSSGDDGSGWPPENFDWAYIQNPGFDYNGRSFQNLVVEGAGGLGIENQGGACAWISVAGKAILRTDYGIEQPAITYGSVLSLGISNSAAYVVGRSVKGQINGTSWLDLGAYVSQYGVLSGDAYFSGGAYTDIGAVVTNNAFFNNYSCNRGLVQGNALFENNASNYSGVWGNAEFRTAYNSVGGYVNGFSTFRFGGELFYGCCNGGLYAEGTGALNGFFSGDAFLSVSIQDVGYNLTAGENAAVYRLDSGYFAHFTDDFYHYCPVNASFECKNLGTVEWNANFIGFSAFAYNEGTVRGDAYFYGPFGLNTQVGEVYGKGWFIGGYNYGTIRGDADFAYSQMTNTQASNEGIVQGRAYFHDASCLHGYVWGNAYFYDNSFCLPQNRNIIPYDVTGVASVYYPAPKPWLGVAHGGVRYFGDYPSSGNLDILFTGIESATIFGAALL